MTASEDCGVKARSRNVWLMQQVAHTTAHGSLTEVAVSASAFEVALAGFLGRFKNVLL